MQVITGMGQKPIKAWTDGVELEDEARAQLINVASLPFIYKHVAVMPDVHWGIGATVGSVIATRGAVMPAAVGVDLSCGMIAVPLSLMADDLPTDLAGIRSAIEAAVPHGRSDDGQANDVGAWTLATAPGEVEEAWIGLKDGYQRVINTESGSGIRMRRRDAAFCQLGTLGTGNHFVELCVDEERRVWVMLHSGSRGVGNAIARAYIELAKGLMRRWYIDLPDPDLAYLPERTQEFDDYVAAVEWAQQYATVNREVMMRATVEAVAVELGRETVLPPSSQEFRVVQCHHNYLAREHHFGQNVLVTRKGAVRARLGDLGIIPGSMGARSYIVRGKGNAESFHSCSHGAGRRMSRGAARKTFTVEDHIAATEGVECRKDAGVLDETPGAYKDIDRVIEAQRDLIDVVHVLKAVVCVKG